MPEQAINYFRISNRSGFLRSKCLVGGKRRHAWRRAGSHLVELAAGKEIMAVAIAQQ